MLNSRHIQRAGTAPKMSRLLCCGVASLLGVSAHALGQIAVTSSNDVAFTQVQYQFDDGSGGDTTDDSATGEVILNEAQIAHDTGVSNGFVNIANSSGQWVAQNIPVVSGVPYLAAEFNLGVSDGTDEEGQNMNFSVDVSSTPIISFTPTGATTFDVAAEEEDGGEGFGAAAAGGAGAPPTIASLVFNPMGLNRSTVQLGHQNVQAATNQCAPAS